jgi:hypothetical protein
MYAVFQANLVRVTARATYFSGCSAFTYTSYVYTTKKPEVENEMGLR